MRINDEIKIRLVYPDGKKEKFLIWKNMPNSILIMLAAKLCIKRRRDELRRRIYV